MPKYNYITIKDVYLKLSAINEVFEINISYTHLESSINEVFNQVDLFFIF